MCVFVRERERVSTYHPQDKVEHLLTSLPGKGSSFTGNTLLETTITKDHEGVVVEQVKAGLVEGGRHVGLRDGESNSVGESLTERALWIGRREGT